MEQVMLITNSLSWILFLLLPLIGTASAFYLETAVGNGGYFTRPYPLKGGNGKPEVDGLYQCIPGSDILRENPIEGVAVWNRPGSQPTLAVALYQGTNCAKVRGTKSKLRLMILLDPNRIRGMHLVNLRAYGISPQCQSWQGVRIQDELKLGGILYGYDNPKLVPGSLIHWNEQGVRTTEPDAIKWINSIPYEPLTSKRQIAQYIREVVEVHVNPEIAADPANADAKALMQNINGFLGISGDTIKDPPMAKEYLPLLKMDVGDSYEPLKTVKDMLSGEAQTAKVGSGLTEATKYAGLSTQGLDVLIENPKSAAQTTPNREAPIGELLRSFNQVAEIPGEKRAWYQGLESQMTENLQVLANAWRILWAWEKANNELSIGIWRGSNNRGQNPTRAQEAIGVQRMAGSQAKVVANRVEPNYVEIEDEVENIGEQGVNAGRGQDVGNQVYEIIDESVEPEESGLILDEIPEEYRLGLASPPALRTGVSNFFGDMLVEQETGGDLEAGMEGVPDQGQPSLTFDMLAATMDELVPPDNFK
ncbi:hypothetical protein TWF718_005110 [Orbilia javanica]|uniref:Uncharacterized protein n=1 Tax=Orbilia javanica TaxID=47235 RepID=A0AAN8MYI0_9PEZI